MAWLEDQLQLQSRFLAAARVKARFRSYPPRMQWEAWRVQDRAEEAAYDHQQQSATESASQALMYRRDVLAENLLLTRALEVDPLHVICACSLVVLTADADKKADPCTRAEHERAMYAAALMPMLAEFGLHPPSSDAQEVTHAVKLVVQRLLSEMQLNERMRPYDKATVAPALPPTWGAGMAGTQPPSPGAWQPNGGPGLGRSRLLESTQAEQALHQPVPGLPPAAAAPPSAPWNVRHSEGSQQQPTTAADHGASAAAIEAWEAPRQPSDEPDANASPEASAPAETGPGLGPSSSALRRSAGHNGRLLPVGEEQPDDEQASDADESNEQTSRGEKLLPGIEGLRIVGDAVLGGKLTACGHSINGTSLCIFQARQSIQWVRHYADGTAAYIEGAAQPEYTITADDCNTIVAIECVPMDEQNRRGVLVSVYANDGDFIQIDAMTQDQLNMCMSTGSASFDVVLLMQDTDSGSEAGISGSHFCTLFIKRSEYGLRRSRNKTLLCERFTATVMIEVPIGHSNKCTIVTADGKHLSLELKDARLRDIAVLAFRQFKKASEVEYIALLAMCASQIGKACESRGVRKARGLFTRK
eukprot:SM000259S08739  [mRNA]  locus=s259:141724:145733:+ [translate_table: standard]